MATLALSTQGPEDTVKGEGMTDSERVLILLRDKVIEIYAEIENGLGKRRLKRTGVPLLGFLAPYYVELSPLSDLRDLLDALLKDKTE